MTKQGIDIEGRAEGCGGWRPCHGESDRESSSEWPLEKHNAWQSAVPIVDGAFTCESMGLAFRV